MPNIEIRPTIITTGVAGATVVSETTYGQSPVVWVATTGYAREDHSHGSVPLPTKAQVGLGNVDNTSDLAKPISTATQTALNNKQNFRAVNSISVNTTAGANTVTDYAYFSTATLTLTLPTAVGNTNRYTVKNNAGTLTIATTLAQTIDGSATAVLWVQYTSLGIVSDGANWNII